MLAITCKNISFKSFNFIHILALRLEFSPVLHCEPGMAGVDRLGLRDYT